MTRYTTHNSPWFIGFDELFSRMEQIHSTTTDNYPPHNVVRIDDDHYVIELAVAGFGENELDISVQNGVLTVVGNREDTRDYVHKGVSTRKFTRVFTLNEHVEAKTASINNGILSIQLERNVPEAQRPRKIAIGKIAESKKTFLSD